MINPEVTKIKNNAAPVIRNALEMLGRLDDLSSALGDDTAAQRGVFKKSLIALMSGDEKNPATQEYVKEAEKIISTQNVIARKAREGWNKMIVSGKRLADDEEVYAALAKSASDSRGFSDTFCKAALDVGTLTDLAQVTGGQALGLISLDTRIARETVRPASFTIYQHLSKSMAYQIVDFWPTASATGGQGAGTAYSSFSSVTSGALDTNAGDYELNTITLKLALDGRAITTALAAQANFVDVGEQETTNAALNILSSVDYAIYNGNPTLYPNQPEGLKYSIPKNNFFDFYNYYTTGPAYQEGWSKTEALFAFLYETTAQIAKYNTYAHPTHAFMSPETIGSFQNLTQTQLNNIINLNGISGRGERSALGPIWDNGNLMGMGTRFGAIQFPMDLFINARETPLQALSNKPGQSLATTTNPTPPASVTAVVNAAGQTGSNFDANFAPSSGATYYYAVASANANMVESKLTWTAAVTGVAPTGSITLTINPPTDATATVFRIFRSSLNPAASTVGSTTDGSGVRLIGEVAANGSSAVTFTDLNTKIPGAGTIYLLDLDENDFALDYRTLLPLSRINLFAQNIYMPWAVAHIGAVRNRIPSWHAVLQNVLIDTAGFDPL